MLDYVVEALKRFHNDKLKKPQDQPHPHIKPKYGAKEQYMEDPDEFPLLRKEDTTFIQEVTGTFLYYAQSVDCTILVALGSIATQQSKPTKNTTKKVKQFLDYALTHPMQLLHIEPATWFSPPTVTHSTSPKQRPEVVRGAFVHI